MKKATIMFSVLLLFVQCSIKTIAPTLFVHGANGFEKIDMRILSRYSNEDSLMKGREIIYQQGRQTVAVKNVWGSKGADYTLIIKDASTKDSLWISRINLKMNIFLGTQLI